MISSIVLYPKKSINTNNYRKLLSDVDNLLINKGFSRVSFDPPTYLSLAMMPKNIVLDNLKLIKSMTYYKTCIDKLYYALNMNTL